MKRVRTRAVSRHLRNSPASPSPTPAPGVSRPTRDVENPRQAQRTKQTTVPALPKLHRAKSSPPPAITPFEYWSFPGEAVTREPPPTFISDVDRVEFDAYIGAGIDPHPIAGEDLFAILGLDFGTSSTKVVVRLPYEAGEPTVAVPAPPSCRSNDDPYLWQTVLWLQHDGTFRPWPQLGAEVLGALKQGLIHGRAEMAISASGALEVTRSHAGVAYLAFVIRYVRGWLRVNRPDLFRGRRPVWFVNVGMPTASYNDPHLAKPYRRVVAAALQLANIGSPVTVETVKLSLDHPSVVQAGEAGEAAEYLGVAVFPEAAPEMTGFAKSARNAPGLYLLVDIGAMTLDVCMFRLDQHVLQPDHYYFMAAQVRPLGVESFHWFLADGKTESDFVQQCERTLRSVVWQTKRDRDPNAETWKPGNDVPILLAGGGAANRMHQDVVASLGPWLKQHVHNDGIRLLELPVPNGLNCPEPLADFGRMLVAWGLSYPTNDIGHIVPMRDIEDIPRATVATSRFRDRFISKDQV